MTYSSTELAAAAAAICVVGFIIGVLVGRRSGLAAGVRERHALAEQLRITKEALEELRESTADHFGRAGELFAELTDRYVAFYRHLARGAATLAQSQAENFPAMVLVPVRDPVLGAESPEGATPAEGGVPAESIGAE